MRRWWREWTGLAAKDIEIAQLRGELEKSGTLLASTREEVERLASDRHLACGEVLDLRRILNIVEMTLRTAGEGEQS